MCKFYSKNYYWNTIYVIVAEEDIFHHILRIHQREALCVRESCGVVWGSWLEAMEPSIPDVDRSLVKPVSYHIPWSIAIYKLNLFTNMFLVYHFKYQLMWFCVFPLTDFVFNIIFNINNVFSSLQSFVCNF